MYQVAALWLPCCFQCWYEHFSLITENPVNIDAAICMYKLTTAHSWQADRNREPLICERKSLTFKLSVLTVMKAAYTVVLTLSSWRCFFSDFPENVRKPFSGFFVFSGYRKKILARTGLIN